MKLKLSLAQKALLLVAIPLGAELIFIAVLGFLLGQAEVEVRKATRGENIAKTGNLVTKLAYDACTNLVAYNLSKSKVFEHSYNRAIDKIPKEMQHLRDLVADDADQSQAMLKIQAAGQKALALFNEAKKRADTEGSVASLIVDKDERDRIETSVNDLASSMEDLLANEEKKMPVRDPAMEQTLTKAVQIALLIGIGMNIAIAIVLTIVFNRSTTKRLASLVENTVRLSDGRELLPKVGGADEIAHLDESFRDMAEARQNADRVKREFLEMVSHDIRTPLTSVTTTLQLMERGVNPDRLTKDLSIARRSITQVVSLLNELLDLHRIDAGKLELDLVEADILELLSEAIDVVRPQAESRGIEIVEANESATVKCDVDRLRQVFVNILSNAIKYSPDKGRVEISVAKEQEKTKVTISDEGPGVEAELQAKIFERFRQTSTADDKEKGGKGLGLAICKGLVEAHGGTIGILSEIGKGSKFWIILP